MDYEMRLPPGLPPGTYTVELSLFDRASAVPASVLDPAGNPMGPAFALDQLAVERPVTPATLDALGVGESAEMVRCGDLGLWRMGVDQERLAPGDPLQVRMVWEAVAPPDAPISVTLSLHDGTSMVRSWSLTPAAPWWPADLWTAGDRWTGRGDLRVPGSAMTGLHTLALALPGCPDMAEHQLRIVAPDRAWTVPGSFTPTDVTFGGLIRLAGVRLDSAPVEPGETVDLALAWEALNEMDRAYRIYTHLLDTQGDLVTQNDGEPAGWTRPTPGWAIGEIVVDPRPLALPATLTPGTYTIRVGVYAPDGPRLRTPEAGDGFVVGRVDVP
jgi:hypothetical protein